MFLNDNIVLCDKEQRIEYDICEIAVGAGYSKTRRFDGQISDFELYYRGYDIRGFIKAIDSFLSLIFLLIVSFCVKKFIVDA